MRTSFSKRDIMIMILIAGGVLASAILISTGAILMLNVASQTLSFSTALVTPRFHQGKVISLIGIIIGLVFGVWLWVHSHKLLKYYG